MCFVKPFGVTSYCISQVIPVDSITNGMTFAFGFGGILNKTAPYGMRVVLSYGNNKIKMNTCIYDNDSQAGAVLSLFAK